MKTLVGIVLKLRQLAPQDQEDILYQIRVVRVLLSQLVSPLIQQRCIQVDESPPGSDLIGPAETIQETGGRHEHATGLWLRDATLVNYKQIFFIRSSWAIVTPQAG